METLILFFPHLLSENKIHGKESTAEATRSDSCYIVKRDNPKSSAEIQELKDNPMSFKLLSNAQVSSGLKI